MTYECDDCKDDDDDVKDIIIEVGLYPPQYWRWIDDTWMDGWMHFIYIHRQE